MMLECKLSIKGWNADLCFAAGFYFDFDLDLIHGLFSRVWIHVWFGVLSWLFVRDVMSLYIDGIASSLYLRRIFIAVFFSSCDPETSTDFPDALNTLMYWFSWVILTECLIFGVFCVLSDVSLLWFYYALFFCCNVIYMFVISTE